MSSDEDDIARAIAMSMGMPPPPSTSGGASSESLGPLLEMGFSADQARAALARAGGDASRAIELLLGGFDPTAAAPPPAATGGDDAEQ